MDINPIPALANEPKPIKPIPEPRQDLRQWPGVCPCCRAVLWAGTEDTHDTTLPGEPWPGAGDSRDTAPVPGMGWAKPPRPGGHQRAAGPRCPCEPLAARLSPRRGFRSSGEHSRAVGSRRQPQEMSCELWAASLSCHHQPPARAVLPHLPLLRGFSDGQK